MAARRRLGLILPACAHPWRRFNLREGFAGIAREALAAGWTVDWLRLDDADAPPVGVSDMPVEHGPTPLIAGAGSAATTQSLRDGHRLWAQVRDQGYDILFGPLAGGILQPCLMSRAAGESLQATSIMLWGDTPSRRRMLLDEEAVSVASLVDDALERTCLRLCDAVFAPSTRLLAEFETLGAPAAACRPGRLPPVLPRSSRLAAGATRRIVHVGPGNRAYGADRFLDTVERAADRGELGAEEIVFAGRWRDSAAGLSKDLLGIRALGWPFAFRMKADATPGSIVAEAQDGSASFVFAGTATDDDMLVEHLVAAGAEVVLAETHRLAEAYPGLVGHKPTPALRPDHPAIAALPPWPALLEAVPRPAAPAPVRETEPRVSVCVTHRDRPDALRNAIASIAPSSGSVLEIIIADAGSRLPESEAVLSDLEALTVIRLGPTSHREACDAAAKRASGEVLAFLDDDNAYRANGCARLAGALFAGSFDIVVANLALYDGVAGVGDPVMHHLFLGEAGSAGLFFNGYGDSSFVIRRDAFERLGGFRGYEGPGNDWAFLARASATGLRIGVLQEPAMAYRRSLAGHDHRWRKRDREEALAEVLRVSAGNYDGELLARLALSRECHSG